MNEHDSPHGGNLPVKLTRLLEIREMECAAIRTTLALLNSSETRSKRVAYPGVFVQALAIERTRRKKTAAPAKTASGLARRIRKQRTATLRFLQMFSDRPRASKGKASAARIGSLVRRGYLLNAGDGYVRTEKPFHVTPEKA